MDALQTSLDYTTRPNQDSSASKLPTAGRSDGGVILNPGQTTLAQFHQLYVHQNQRQPRDPNQDPDTIPDPDPPHHELGATACAPNSNDTTLITPLPRQEAADVASDQVRCQYRECLKNHAANIGGHVVDGCGEFMPSGEEGTLEAFKCAACDCHRNFHRKETQGGESSRQITSTNVYYSHNPNGINMRPTNQIPPPARRHQHHHHNFPNHYSSHSLASPTGPVMMAFGGRGPEDQSSSEDLNMVQSAGGGGQHYMVAPSTYSGSKKRFRTKFSKEQKDRMYEVAEKMGWKIQKQDDEEVQQLCQELGVKRQVFKVWMHNNKQAMKKKQQDDQ